MAPLPETARSPGDTSPPLIAGPSHYSLTFNIIQDCQPSSAQLSSLFLLPGYQPVSQALHFEISSGVPFSTVLKPPIMSFPLAADHSRGGPSYFNFGSILPPLAFSSATFSWRENEVETVGGMKAHPCTPSIAFPWPAQMHS